MTNTNDSASKLAALPRVSLRNRAVAALRDAITLGELRPGQHLVETQLSEDLGISRGTLREAMRQLQYEGLVVEDARGRTHVPEITPELIREAFQVRIALEAMAAVTVSGRPDVAHSVLALRDRLDALQRSETESMTANVDADLAFHREICLQSRNSMLLAHWDALAAIIRMSILFAGPRLARHNMAASRHEPLVSAIESGDFAVIWRTFETHNSQAVDGILGATVPEVAAE